MKYLFGAVKIKKKYEEEIKQILEHEKYRIKKIESFDKFCDSLYPFLECEGLSGVSFSPISFSECEYGCRLIGKDGLSYYKEIYDNAKYKWAKIHCTTENVKKEENLEMIKEVQKSTLPFGAFSITFQSKRLENMSVKSRYSDRMIPYAPLLYEFEDVHENVLEYYCEKIAEGMEEGKKFKQMNVYMDNLLSPAKVDEAYKLVREICEKYNGYVTELYNTYKDSEIYRHRNDFPL